MSDVDVSKWNFKTGLNMGGIGILNTNLKLGSIGALTAIKPIANGPKQEIKPQQEIKPKPHPNNIQLEETPKNYLPLIGIGAVILFFLLK